MNVSGTALRTAVLSAAMVVLTSAAGLGAAQAATAAPPSACPAVTNPKDATNTVTRKQRTMPNGQTLELRSGNVNGKQYAWARILNSNDGDGLLTSSSFTVCMRAGGQPKGATSSYLTDWWC
ncbi:hypothetical protein [Nonomuraea sp. NPDC005692]|uniref:hypothetical protein n=1 Tax=Nonomuraea sp. NPDC005692 TaxID=3157168 RepID=UPI0033D0D542